MSFLKLVLIPNFGSPDFFMMSVVLDIWYAIIIMVYMFYLERHLFELGVETFPPGGATRMKNIVLMGLLSLEMKVVEICNTLIIGDVRLWNSTGFGGF